MFPRNFITIMAEFSSLVLRASVWSQSASGCEWSSGHLRGLSSSPSSDAGVVPVVPGNKYKQTCYGIKFFFLKSSWFAERPSLVFSCPSPRSVRLRTNPARPRRAPASRLPPPSLLPRTSTIRVSICCCFSGFGLQLISVPSLY